jgi:hypothetical protein
MPKQTFVWLSVSIIVCCFLIPYLGLIHYLLPERGAHDEFQAWSIFLRYFAVYWFLWVPVFTYLLWRLMSSAGMVRLGKDA